MLSLTKSWMIPLLIAAGTLLLSGCTSPTAGLGTIPAAEHQTYRLAAGDKIRITVPDLQNTDAEFTVDQTGAVSLPIVKDVKIAGMTLREAELAIEQALITKQVLVRPSVSVQAMALRPIYILGEVNKPGEYSYRDGLTIFSLVSMAGGYTYRADTKSMTIIRTVDGRAVTGKADEQTPVLPGDQIRIVEKWF